MQKFSDLFSNTASRGPSFVRDCLIVLGSLGVIILALAVWANYFRKSPSTNRRQRRRRGSEGREPGSSQEVDLEQELRPSDQMNPKRRRKRRREHRPRNPTLAEKGGLPPPRPDDVSPRGT